MKKIILQVFAVFLVNMFFLGQLFGAPADDNAKKIVPVITYLLSGDEPVKANVGGVAQTTQNGFDSHGGKLSFLSGDMAGIVVNVPEGTFESNTTVKLSKRLGSLNPNDGLFSRKMFSVETNASTYFRNPIKITIPFDNSKGFPVPYSINASGNIEPCQIVDINNTASTLSFESYKTAIFTWIYANINSSASSLTDYRAKKDGFRITNQGTPPLSTGGECLGMSTYSIWHFVNKGTGLYNKYTQPLTSCSAGNTIGQDIIATRAHLSVSRQIGRYWTIIDQIRNQYNDIQRVSLLKNILRNTKVPTAFILSAYPGGGLGSYHHAVVAYDVSNSNQISIYDSNYPNQERKIHFDNATKRFVPYDTFTTISPLGYGSFSYTEPFEDIWKDAEDSFTSPDATITISSHTSGQNVSDRHIVLKGKIESGQALSETLEVYIGGNAFTARVDKTTGQFSVNVTLDPGENTLNFIVKAYDVHNQLVTISNNMQCSQFKLNAPDDGAIMLVTLTWDKGDTDVDLYAIDPNGDYSYYNHKRTSDGGELDYDDINGYGPEHWTLQYSDTIRYGEDYRIRLHYYSDHGNGGTNYRVTIKMYEGTRYETAQVYTGYLSYDNSYNDSPNDTGSDWVDIATIRPVNVNAPASSVPKYSSTPNNVNGKIILTVPVASKEERQKAKEENIKNNKE